MKELETARSYLSKALNYYVGASHLTDKYLGCQLLILALISVSDAMIYKLLPNITPITQIPSNKSKELWSVSYETRVADLQKIEKKYSNIIQKGEFSEVLERTLKSLLPSSEMSPLISLNFKSFLNDAYSFLQNVTKTLEKLPQHAGEKKRKKKHKD
ncbi:MAG: hypothetical protein ACFFCZ_25350 [Promethearchaeota archaeon]